MRTTLSNSESLINFFKTFFRLEFSSIDVIRFPSVCVKIVLKKSLSETPVQPLFYFVANVKDLLLPLENYRLMKRFDFFTLILFSSVPL